MQGFILAIRRVRDEDLLVTVLTEHRLMTLYRFYGARHATINLGYKIDFDYETSAKTSLLRLRNVLHLGYPWLFSHEKLFMWQNFCKHLMSHLNDVEELDPFYFQLWNFLATRWDKTDPKRLMIEGYLTLLEHEGRLHEPRQCFLCDNPLGKSIALGRAFLPSHPECLGRLGFDYPDIMTMWETKKTLTLDDSIIDRLYAILTEGF